MAPSPPTLLQEKSNVTGFVPRPSVPLTFFEAKAGVCTHFVTSLSPRATSGAVSHCRLSLRYLLSTAVVPSYSFVMFLFFSETAIVTGEMTPRPVSSTWVTPSFVTVRADELPGLAARM